MTDLRDQADGPSTPLQASGVVESPSSRWSELHEQIKKRNAIARVIDNPALPFPKLDRFELHQRLGSGGMGVVFKAYDPQLRRFVALKVCKFDDDAAIAIEHEARCLAKITHPNVVAVYEVVRTGVEVLLVMELLNGKTLRKWQVETAPTWREVLALYVDAGRGLAAGHAAGLLHGDFKSDNVMVGDDGRVRVVDFGIALHLASQVDQADRPSDELDVTGMGTKGYMAPERLLGQPSDARADVFSFCVALWAALYGTRPYAGQTAQELLDSMKAGVLASERPLWGVPPQIRSILAAGLSPRRSLRPPSMDVLLRMLVDASEAEQHRVERRRRTGVVGLVTVLAAALVLQTIAMQRERAEPSEPERVLEPAPEPPKAPEPSVERAIELAATGAPLAAWDELREVDEITGLEVGTLLMIATILLNRGREATPMSEEALGVASNVALRAKTKAVRHGTISQQIAARALLSEIRARQDIAAQSMQSTVPSSLVAPQLHTVHPPPQTAPAGG